MSPTTPQPKTPNVQDEQEKQQPQFPRGMEDLQKRWERMQEHFETRHFLTEDGWVPPLED